MGTLVDGQIGETIHFRYDGLDADSHVVEIGDLATSLKGLGRILSVVGTFVVSEKVVERAKVRPVRIMVGPPREGCVVIQAAMAWLDQHSFVGGLSGGLLVNLVTYIFVRAAGQKEEMKHLAASLETAIRELGHRDDKVVEGLLSTINRMADVLKPAAKQAVLPVGRSAGTLTIGEENSMATGHVIDRAERDAIYAVDPPQIGNEVEIELLFVEMNLDSKSCRVVGAGEDDHRVSAEITDPEFLVPNNAYVTAFAAKSPLVVRAKPTLRDGSVERWYISGHD
ncbi:MAG: hypothetical protein JWR85_3563 [Marmoricola sp.]|nr:hypothetical protein [Marmoricola sp.]